MSIEKDIQKPLEREEQPWIQLQVSQNYVRNAGEEQKMEVEIDYEDEYEEDDGEDFRDPPSGPAFLPLNGVLPLYKAAKAKLGHRTSEELIFKSIYKQQNPFDPTQSNNRNYTIQYSKNKATFIQKLRKMMKKELRNKVQKAKNYLDGVFALVSSVSTFKMDCEILEDALND